MSKLSYCLCLIMLSSCYSSSLDRASLFGVQHMKDSYVVKSIFGGEPSTRSITHTPVQNPGGVLFDLDKDFAKSYALYEKHMQKKDLVEDVKESTSEQPVDRFTLYKLMGASKVDTSSAGWDVDYIPAPKEKTAIEKIVDSITPDENSKSIFGHYAPSKELIMHKAKSIFSAVKKDRISEYQQSSRFSGPSIFDDIENVPSNNSVKQEISKEGSKQSSISTYTKKVSTGKQAISEKSSDKGWFSGPSIFDDIENSPNNNSVKQEASENKPKKRCRRKVYLKLNDSE